MWILPADLLHAIPAWAPLLAAWAITLLLRDRTRGITADPADAEAYVPTADPRVVIDPTEVKRQRADNASRIANSTLGIATIALAIPALLSLIYGPIIDSPAALRSPLMMVGMLPMLAGFFGMAIATPVALVAAIVARIPVRLRIRLVAMSVISLYAFECSAALLNVYLFTAG